MRVLQMGLASFCNSLDIIACRATGILASPSSMARLATTYVAPARSLAAPDEAAEELECSTSALGAHEWLNSDMRPYRHRRCCCWPPPAASPAKLSPSKLIYYKTRDTDRTC